MLCQFTFSNFKSYRDEVTLDFCPANISEHPETLIVDKTDNTKYLPVAAIYGPNGGGKSNVIEAFLFLRKTVLTQPRLDENEFPIDKTQTVRSHTTTNKHFMFNNSGAVLPTSFEVIFRVKGYEFKYILKIKAGLVFEENLYATDIKGDIVSLVFERSKDNIELGDSLSGAQAESINPAMPLIQFLAATYDYDIPKDVVSWFKATYVINYGNPRYENAIFFPDTEDVKKLFFGILNEMDINISDIRIDKDEDGKITNIQTEYKVLGGNYYLNYDQESAGTQKLLSFLMLPLNALKKGSVLFVDELDAKLHPKMLEYIIKLFTDPSVNKNGAQLVITSHDIYTMNNVIFRRDEIWFAARSNDLSSRLYSLSDFKKGDKKARKDENYGKQYIEGRYGADPYLKKIVEWEV